MLRAKRAQSTLEYVLIFTAIIAGIIVFANTVLKQKVQGSLEHVSSEMENAVNKIKY
jgi:Flp pilus assembly pilin Flp